MSDKSELLEVFNGIQEALLTNDIEAIKKLFAEDYTGYNIRGDVETRDTVLQAYQPGVVKLSTLETNDLHVKIIGEVGFVSGLGYIKGTFEEYSFEHRIRFLDVFIKRRDKWQFFISQGTEIHL